MEKKKTFTVRFYKNVSGAWCGGAFFVNDDLKLKSVYTAAASPEFKKAIATSYINGLLDGWEAQLQSRHPSWRRVTEEEYDKFVEVRRR